MNDDELFQNIVINETDNGTIDKINKKIEKQNQLIEKSNKSASKSNSNFRGITAVKGNAKDGIEYDKDLAKIFNDESLDKLQKTAKNSVKKGAKSGKSDVDDAAKASAARLDAVTKSVQKLQKSLDFTNLVFKVKALGMAFEGAMNIAKSGTQIVEENNLFYNQLTNVSKEYGEVEKSATRYYERAIDYQNKLYEATHLNRVENMKSQGAFFQLFNAQGVGEELSYQLSEWLSNASIDLSSLFNIDYDEMVAKLKSGIIGNSRPLRELGIDVTEGTMQGILDELGIDTTVEKLTFAEKEILRYMTIVKQVGYAQGDFANTFQQSANQIRVFESELQTVGQMVGAIFNKLLSNVMSVARGIIMAVEEILTALGSLIGVDWSDTGTTKPLASLGEEVDDVATGIGGATAAAKEFKKQLMSFDEIHNLTPPDKSSGGGGGGGAAGLNGLLNSALTDELQKWQSNFEKIDDEAKKIKDNILKTLGFSKDINGNLKWSITDFWNNIGGWGRNIIRALQIILAFKIGAKIVELAGNIKKIMALLDGKMLKGSGLEVGIKMLGNTFKATRENFNQMIDDWAFGDWDKNGAATKFMTQLGGITSAIIGIVKLFQDVRAILDGTVEAADMLPAVILRITQAITGVIAVITAVQASISPIVSILSLVVSIVTGIVASFVELGAEGNKEFTQLKNKINDAAEARKKYNEAAKETRESTLKEIDEGKSTLDYYNRLKEELVTLVDANGKIKTGNEARVKFIMGELKTGLGVEYDLNGNIIKQYDDYISNINKAIQAKKNEIYINAFQDDYTEALKRSKTATNDLSNASQNLQDIENSEKYKKALEKYGWLKDRLKEAGYEFKETGNKAEDFKKVCQLIQAGGTFGWISDTDQGIKDLKVDTDKLTTAWLEVNNGATNGMEDVLKTWDTAKTTFDDTSTSIINDSMLMTAYQNLMTAQIKGDAAEIEQAQINLSNVYNQQSDKNVATIEQQMIDMIYSTNRFVEENKKAGKEITKDQQDALDNSVKNVAMSLREQTRNVETLTPKQVQAWKDLSTYSHDIYNEQISQLDPETQLLLNTLTGNVKAEEKTYWDAWSNMAVNASDKFKEKISSIPEEERTTLLAGLTSVKGCEQATIDAYGQLSDKGKAAYIAKIANLPDTQKQNILAMLGEFRKQDGEAGKVAGELADTIQKAIDGEELKIGDEQVNVDGNAIDEKIKGAIGTVTVPIKGKYQATWHWVPKQDGSGEYEQRYFARGGRPQKGQIFIAREAGAELVGNIGGSTGVMNNIQIITAVAKGVSSAVANVLKAGFKIEMPQDNSVTNVQEELVNEIRTSNEYASQEIKAARPSVSSKYGFTTNANEYGTQGLAQVLAAAVEYGMSNANVNVKVEAKTDTGVVLKQVSEAVGDYVNQTGQLPFAIPM